MFLFKTIMKNIIQQFFYPLPFCIWLSFTGLILFSFSKKKKIGKKILITGLLLILFLSSSSVSDRMLGVLEKKYEPDTTQLSCPIVKNNSLVKYIVVLGGGQTINAALPITSQINIVTLVRLIEGIRLYKKISDCKLVLSSGKISGAIPDGDLMTNLAKELGIKNRDIILESESRDTKDQAKFIKAIVKKNPFILVTSASHMPRSIAMFHKVGLNPIPAPTEHRVNISKSLFPALLFPTTSSLLNVERALYEYLGIFWAKLRRQI